MIAQLYANSSKNFDAIATSWLDLGATSFSISKFGTEIMRWPEQNSSHTATLSAPIEYMGLTLGELHVEGLIGAKFQHKLNTEAALLANIIQLEGELEAIISELVDAQDHLLAFYDIGRSTQKLLNLDEIIEAVTEAVHQMSQVECSFTILRLPDRNYFYTQIPQKYINQDTLCWAYQQLQNNQNTVINNNNDVASPLPSQMLNFLMSPIRYHGEIIGGIGLMNRLSHKFSTPDVKLIEAICQQAEVKIENAIFYEQTLQQTKMQTEMALAQKVQLQLLPQSPPMLPTLDIAASSLPALQVGGDFFDFIQIPNGPMIFTVGDVAGKGMSSALLMAMSRTAIRGAVKMLQSPLPEAILDRTNEDLYDDFTEVGMFATMFVGYFLPSTQEIIYANAGHSPVVYCPHDDAPILLEADGTAVGVLPMNLAKNQTIRFRSGDLLVVATDGFSEASNAAGELFGYDRLLMLIGNNRHLCADALFELLHNIIAEFSQSQEQDDDQTIIILKAK
jgi:sigma-B regulation protein RsbU (phosphoserine phosphatase)